MKPLRLNPVKAVPDPEERHEAIPIEDWRRGPDPDNRHSRILSQFRERIKEVGDKAVRAKDLEMVGFASMVSSLLTLAEHYHHTLVLCPHTHAAFRALATDPQKITGIALEGRRDGRQAY